MAFQIQIRGRRAYIRTVFTVVCAGFKKYISRLESKPFLPEEKEKDEKKNV